MRDASELSLPTQRVLAMVHKCHKKLGSSTVPNQDFHFPNLAAGKKKKTLEFEYE
jgi:hypothetical protein